jgi:hypothetical protein
MISVLRCGQIMQLFIIIFMMCDSGLFVGDAKAAGYDIAGSLTVSIENIRYTEIDEYLITLAIVNRSAKAYHINRIDCIFKLQKENGWHALQSGQPAGKRLILPLLVAAGAQSDFKVHVKVPVALPGLFKTYEGDISLMLTYHLRYDNDSAGNEAIIAGESLYWISPGTSKWIHREGM